MNSAFRESSFSNFELNGVFPDCIDEVFLCLCEWFALDDQRSIFLTSPNRVFFDVQELNNVGAILQESLRIKVVGVLDFNGIVKFLEKSSSSSVKLSNDLDNNAFFCNRVDGFERFASAKVQDTVASEQEHKSFLGFLCHSFQSSIDVASLLQYSETRFVSLTSVCLIGGVCFTDSFREFIETLLEVVELASSHLNNMLQCLIDPKAREQHRAVSSSSNDAHLLQARQTVVCIEASGLKFLGELTRSHVGIVAEDHNGANLSLRQTSLIEKTVPHQSDPPVTDERLLRIRAT